MSWEEAESAGTPLQLSANAPAFSLNAAAAEWTPSFAVAPPAAPAEPTDAAPAPAPAVAAVPPPTPTESAPEAEAAPAVAEAAPAVAVPAAGAGEAEAAPAPAPEDTADAEPAAADEPSADDEPSTPVATKETKVEEPADDSDPRDHLNVVFIGHVDAGKSTLCGRILFSTGMVDQRIIDKFEKEAKARNRESWFLAFIMDINEEERAKGKTVEVGRAHFQTEKRRYTILDAPGHKNYVPNMIAGAAQADVGVLVISARRGEFETGFERGGQTREHALLAKTLGVRQLVVVINKMDNKTVKWGEARFNECKDGLTPFLKEAGFNTKKNVHFVPLSALTGEGVNTPIPEGVAPWWDGYTLLQQLDHVKISGRDAAAPVVIPVLDKYNDRGVIVLGKVEAGTLRVGDTLNILPTNNTCTVEQLFVDDEPVSTARVGENVTLKVKGCSEEDVHKGFVLCAPERELPSVHLFEAQLMLLDLDNRLFTAGYDAVLHIHTCAEEVRIVKLLSEYKKGKQSERPPRFVRSGAICNAVLKVPQSVTMTTYEDMAQLGRFTLRDEGRTIAIGKVLYAGDPRTKPADFDKKVKKEKKSKKSKKDKRSD